MASIRLYDGASVDLCTTYLNGVASPGAFWYHAFVNDFSPSPATVIGAFTECTTAGYSAEHVLNSGWVPVTSPSGTTRAVNSLFAWVLTDAVTLYGYYVEDGSGNLLWSQRFDTPVVFGALGGTVTIEPAFTFVSPVT